ncbi:glycosyltransferase [marine bacterium AO1-C]|nr:glycosyltransferase [marine bacterium AO1-C]
MNSVKVLNIPLYSKDIPTATQTVIDTCKNEEKQNRCVSATGAHGLVYAKRNEEFRNTLHNFSINLPDGMPGVWVGKLKGAKQMKRCYGPDFFMSLLQHSAQEPVKHFFCGGKDGVAEALKTACEEKFKNHNIVGTYCPPFKPVDQFDYKEIADIINQTNADVVWIGLSTPKQELFAKNLAKHSNVHYIITVGAAFDFHTGNVKQAPKLMQKMGLEWFFRLCMEPKRLYKRYLEIVPMFIFYNLKELFTFAKHK